MSRFWEIVVNSSGKNRFYCFPFLFLFRLITPVYQFFSRRNLQKRSKRRSRDWQAKVISIGNITVGGSGKTPLIIWLAREFIRQGQRVFVVHSGYGRSDKKDYLIYPGSNEDCSVAAIGDEVAMMRKLIPNAGFAIGRDKKKMVIRATQEIGADIVLIDDGFQRLDIEKDIDICVVSPEIFKDTSDKRRRRRMRLFPSGILREPLQAIKRADAVFVLSSDEEALRRFDATAVSEINPDAVFRWKLDFGRIAEGDNAISPEKTTELRPYLFAGIGSFERLEKMVREAGIQIKGSYNLGDHYRYDKMDFEHLKFLSGDVKADCYLTTAKDMVKLPSGGLDKPVYCLELIITPLDSPGIGHLFGWNEHEKLL